MSELVITDGDRLNPLFRKLMTHYEEQLRIMRAQNDDPQKSETDTAVLRGRIQFCKAFLSHQKVEAPIFS